MRKNLLKNKRAVSEVVGYILMITIASTVLAATIYTSSQIIDRKITEVGSYQAKALANQIADAIVDVTWIKRSLPDANYERIIKLPDDIAGLSYYIQLTDDAVYVNTSDGRISEKSTTYKAKDLGIGVSGKVYGGTGNIKIACNKTEYVYRFDFGTYEGIENDTVTHSPIQPGYYWASNETKLGYLSKIPSWADSSRPYRLPIVAYAYKNLSKYWVSIYLASSNFDYSLANKSGLDLAVYNFSGVRLPCWIEEWNPNGTSTVWFMIDNISKNETRYFYLYYGNEHPSIDWNFLYLSDNKSKLYNKYSDDNFLFYDDFNNLNNWSLTYAPTATTNGGYAFLGYNDTIILRTRVVTRPGEPKNPSKGNFTANATFYYIEAKVNISDNNPSKTADVDLLPITTPRLDYPSNGRRNSLTVAYYYPFCLPIAKKSTTSPNATSLWRVQKIYRYNTVGTLYPGYPQVSINNTATSIGGTAEDRWSIIKANVLREYVKDWTNSSWATFEEYNYTGIDVKSFDNTTSQIYNSIYGYEIFNGSNMPPSSITLIIDDSYIGFGCGMFYHLLNDTMKAQFDVSTNQKAYVDWVSVRKKELYVDNSGTKEAVTLALGGRESIFYGWDGTTGIGSGDTIRPSLLLRDFNNATIAKTFEIVNLSAGTYSITITMGDNNQSHDHMYVSASIDYYGGGTENLGDVISDLSTDAGEFETNWFTVTLQNRGNISLTFRDDDGSTAGDTGWVVNGIDIERGIKGVRMEVE